MNKEVMIVTGAGQISMAIARRVGFGKKIILGDKKIDNANAIAKVMNEAGYNVCQGCLAKRDKENRRLCHESKPWIPPPVR